MHAHPARRSAVVLPIVRPGPDLRKMFTGAAAVSHGPGAGLLRGPGVVGRDERLAADSSARREGSRAGGGKPPVVDPAQACPAQESGKSPRVKSTRSGPSRVGVQPPAAGGATGRGGRRPVVVDGVVVVNAPRRGPAPRQKPCPQPRAPEKQVAPRRAKGAAPPRKAQISAPPSRSGPEPAPRGVPGFGSNDLRPGVSRASDLPLA